MNGSLALMAALARLALRDTRRRIGQSIALLVLATLFFGLALASLVVALGIWLAQVTTPLAAALIIAAGAMVLGLVFLGAYGLTARRTNPALAEMRREAGKLADFARSEVGATSPLTALASAGVAGLVLGLLLFRRR